MAGKTYSAKSGQGWRWALVFLVVMIVIHFLLQSVAALVFHMLLFGGLPDFVKGPLETQADMAKAALAGMLPASLLMAVVSWWIAGQVNPSKERGLPLHFVQLGPLGWVLTIVGSLFAIWMCFVLTFWVLGIDMQSYMPTSDGIRDPNSSSGIVEKTMADLADEPWLFALVLPGIVIGAPLVEEFIFRGAVFAAIRQTWFGQTGAVLFSALSWALIHGASAPWLFVFVIFLMGILLGLLLLRFGSLWVPIAVHAAWNAMTSFSILGSVAGT